MNPFEEENREFKANHPHYCTTCKGWGCPDADLDRTPCPDCWGQGKCPHCGDKLENPESCPCGWRSYSLVGLYQ